jgi:predicted dehydrogenase
MKFLICGLGSIGQRHVRMIRKVMNDEAEIAAYRSRKLDVVISDTLEAVFGRKPEEYYGIQSFSTLHEALSWGPDIVFVTNPISLHISTAIAAARAGCHIFIEKPLSHDDKGIEELVQLVGEKRLVCMVGYQMRYHPGYIMIRKLLAQTGLGRLVSADLHFGEWLPGMHPYEDYRESHAARRDQGGGVILCLSHEIDNAFWLFGKPLKAYAVGGHLSDLEMDVEDTADILLSCAGDQREFPVHIHLDFLQKPARRYIHIVGEKGSVIFNYCTNELEINLLSGSGSKKIVFDAFQRNDMFLQEVSAFIGSVRNRTQPPISLEDGITTLRICLAAKRSLVTGQVEAIV